MSKFISTNDLSVFNHCLRNKKVIDQFHVFCYIARLKLSSLEISTSSILMMRNCVIDTEINNIHFLLQVRQETAN